MNYIFFLFYDLKFFMILGLFILFVLSDVVFVKIFSDVMIKFFYDKDFFVKVIKYYVVVGKQLMFSFSNDIEIGLWENGYKIRINCYYNGQVRDLFFNLINGFM